LFNQKPNYLDDTKRFTRVYKDSGENFSTCPVNHRVLEEQEKCIEEYIISTSQCDRKSEMFMP